MPVPVWDFFNAGIQAIISNPTQILVWLALTSGFLFGEAGSKLDFLVLSTGGFQKLGVLDRFAVKFMLDLLHHFQYGLGLMWLSYQVPEPFSTFLFNFGFGMFASDLRDFQNLRRRFMIMLGAK
jgi:hypothetical protein